ncbi:hypothetical protein [Pseudofrankia inefficax]|uniref:Uncharacterized protein n=1 Tax=Pseudofrankia inefficax (strain DSM 45817 / CECT 9037 / DDB 130130 / EuI1c) TaxID=298654 RepID=E3JD15_PSEI1|nr:hypothetical protein [Pseudofrankia inefficax]ADP81154.1 hypothetical protein FraEuI1c_3134 [Pseudofrankia inefficax]
MERPADAGGAVTRLTSPDMFASQSAADEERLTDREDAYGRRTAKNY